MEVDRKNRLPTRFAARASDANDFKSQGTGTKDTDWRWKVQGSRYVLRDRWICLRADDCVTASGVEVSPYYVLEYPDFVHVAAFDAQDRLILVQQYRHGLGGVSLELPGGTADPADADEIATAKRELVEETGYGSGTFSLRATLSTDPAKLANRLHLVVASDVRPGTSAPDATEQISVHLVAREVAVHLALSGAIMNAQHVGLLLMALQWRP